MSESPTIPVQVPHDMTVALDAALSSAGCGTGLRTLRVFMMDLLPTVPYYTGHLCQGLQAAVGVNATLGSATYTHDPDFFTRMGLRHVAPLDFSIRLGRILSAARRPAKLVEYLLNLLALTVRMLVSKPDLV